ncbi:glycosyltransferase family 4 protein [Flavobacterium sp. W1B]|uniref:glycosyltransferase family 4 protein n=1 Tax=Flavobacterium sp. W1B TaxID=3394146 RepID=UPI0039BD66A1
MKIGYEAKRIFHNKTGLGNYSRDVIRVLSTYYSDNSYFLYNPKKSDQSLFEANNSNVFEQLPKTKFTRKFKNYWRQKGIVNDLKKDNISLFHGLSGELPIGLKANNIKSVVTIHDLIFMRYPKLYSFFDRKIHYLKFKKAAKAADKIIAISEQTKEDIVTFLNVDPDKIEVIYQGCQSVFKEKHSDQEKEEVANHYKLPQNFILNVGTIEERKNAFTIVKAIKNIDTKLVIIGKETNYSKKIRDYITDNNLENKVIFLKGLTSKELAIIYQLATVFVYPSIFEGFGIPIIEALYSKVPVITNKFGVFPEAGGPDSLYIDPYNTVELEEKINTLLHDASLRKEIAEKGFEFVQKFNDQNIASKINKLYSEV